MHVRVGWLGRVVVSVDGMVIDSTRGYIMTRPLLVLFAVVGLASSAGPPVPEPLPGGAIRRHGTARFRHGGLVRALAFSRDGKTLCSSSHDHTVRAWDVSTGPEW